MNIDLKKVIAICGNSGSGKTTLMKTISDFIEEKDKILLFETDRYHKWERGDRNYLKYTHLNPISNFLYQMKQDLIELINGRDIFQVDYDHAIGKFTDKDRIQSKKYILFCGLHTLYDIELNQNVNVKIFMNTDSDLIKEWKIKRDVEERGYKREMVLNEIERRKLDYNNYIDFQKNHSDIIINFFKNNIKNNILCLIIIKNKEMIKKIDNYPDFQNNQHEKLLIDNELHIILDANLHKTYYIEISKMIIILIK